MMQNLQTLQSSGNTFGRDRPLNLSTNSPPVNSSVFNTEISAAMERALENEPFDQLLSKHRWQGTDRDRAAARMLLGNRLSETITSEDIVVSNGVQSAVVMILMGLLPNGGTLLTEDLTYPGVSFISTLVGVKVVGVRTDRYGMDPEALEKLCRANGNQVVFPLPTLQNPTTITMPEERRLEIVCVARKYGVPIIEDDIYSLLPLQPGIPLYSLAPELTWYVLGLGKTLGAGLKTTYIVPPTSQSAHAFFWPGVRTTLWMAPPINVALTTQLIEGGGIHKIVAAARNEVRKRSEIASRQLEGLDFSLGEGGFHVWLRLPTGVGRHRVAEALRSEGIVVSKSDVYATENRAPPEAIRIGIGNPLSAHTVRQALAIIAEQIAAIGT